MKIVTSSIYKKSTKTYNFLPMIEECKPFQIALGPLKNGHEEVLNEAHDAGFLGIREPNLTFSGNVCVKGEAYIANETLIVHISITANGVVPCSICNEPVDCPIEVKGLYQTIPLEELKGAFYDMRPLIRETILLEVPEFVECNEGLCTERSELKQYLRDPKADADEGYHPFEDLTLDE